MLKGQHFELYLCAAMFVWALAVVIHDTWLGLRHRGAASSPRAEALPLRWRTGLALAFLAWLPLIIVVLADGF